MPKKQPKNAFYFFMLDFKREQERKGRKMSLPDVATDPLCSQMWKNMSKTDRGQYEKRAKDMKIQERGMVTKKTGTGESIDSLEREERHQREMRATMLQYVDSYVHNAQSIGELPDREFYLIHVNYFYVKEGEGKKPFFAPAEFAVVRFSLRRGIIDVLHDLVYCKPQTGYALAAKERSEICHHIPTEHGEQNFAKIYDKLKVFMSAGDYQTDDIPLYARENDVPILQTFIDLMAGAAGRNYQRLQVYHWEMLFYALRTASDQMDGMSIPVAGYEITKDTFSYTPGLECSVG